MKGIVLTEIEKNGVFNLIKEYYEGTNYGSFANFTQQEKRNIVAMPLKNDLFTLSDTVLTDPIYAELKEFIISKDLCDFVVRDIQQDELKNNEF